MEFKEKQAIYLQIADYVCDHILSGQWKAGERLLSVRELAVKLEVNPNTVMRTYDALLKQNILLNKRGIGFFVDNEAVNRIIQFRKQRFMHEELPLFIKNIHLLQIGWDEIEIKYNEYIENQQNRFTLNIENNEENNQ
jgi:GntR family transcriptional regulator